MVNANRILPLALLCLAFLEASGCAYLSDRGRDFGECFRAECGALTGLGTGVKAAGLAHAGVGGAMMGITEEPWPVAGWEYGFAYAGNVAIRGVPKRGGSGGMELYPPLTLLFMGYHGSGVFGHGEGYSGAHEGRTRGHECYLLLPAVFSVVTRGNKDSPILWRADNGWVRLHAFDLEASVYVVVGARLGISPGELTDFLLGWFGVDIAGDDRRDGDGPYEIEAAIEKAEEELEDEE